MTVVRSALVWLGGGALLAATAVDTLSVIGRQIGLPVHGAIEMIQAAVLVSGGLSLVMATLAGNHARVHFVLDRLAEPTRRAAQRACDVAVAVFFGALLLGSGWIAADLWNAHEVSELVGVPWIALRAFANLCLAAVVVVTLLRVAGRRG